MFAISPLWKTASYIDRGCGLKSGPHAEAYAVHVPLQGYIQQYKCDFNGFGPSQKVCYKSGPKNVFNGFGPSQNGSYKHDLNIMFKLCRPFKHNFQTIKEQEHIQRLKIHERGNTR